MDRAKARDRVRDGDRETEFVRERKGERATESARARKRAGARARARERGEERGERETKGERKKKDKTRPRDKKKQGGGDRERARAREKDQDRRDRPEITRMEVEECVPRNVKLTEPGQWFALISTNVGPPLPIGTKQASPIGLATTRLPGSPLATSKSLVCSEQTIFAPVCVSHSPVTLPFCLKIPTRWSVCMWLKKYRSAPLPNQSTQYESPSLVVCACRGGIPKNDQTRANRTT